MPRCHRKAGSCSGQEVSKSAYFGPVPRRGEIQLSPTQERSQYLDLSPLLHVSLRAHMLVRVWVVCWEGRGKKKKARGGVFRDEHRSPKGVLVASPASSRPNPTGQWGAGTSCTTSWGCEGCLKWRGQGNEDGPWQKWVEKMCPIPLCEWNSGALFFFRVQIDRHKALPCCWCGALPCLWLAEVITAVQNMLFQDQPLRAWSQPRCLWNVWYGGQRSSQPGRDERTHSFLNCCLGLPPLRLSESSPPLSSCPSGDSVLLWASSVFLMYTITFLSLNV